jgi:hypothetical protein
LVLIDPDNGFEPKRSSEKHLRFLELKQILDQLPNRSIVSIFQHFRRIPFSTDYLTIRENLPNLTTAAIHSSSLMFVAVSKSAKAIEAVAHANDLYSESHRVVALK